MGLATLVWLNFTGPFVCVRLRTEGPSGSKSGDILTIGFDAARLHLLDVKTEIQLSLRGETNEREPPTLFNA
jgi:multiple sugar transport system ATP-binding protein